ncbi:uncharacterized protein LOC126824880 [Patella vulgata]|uniref:uncharacterized protein LOC126824880 n=1 Tax=Patella vulgata TaxID=6465 RepID=UPI00218050DD|nr:uncharacterized protein LOC126824880 [Patella vulgata]XP_050410248.1 uncharacterized protein LOC126824880 [Patella vulgata]XP_050410249.1 uncharacterized protein LOC126824880 [Patella vulgata]XP_050410250.1 uncharacterized protein LOC126824880 [Patella vulgata]
MDRYSPDYSDDEPLDLSIKSRGGDKVPTTKAAQPESPLCLVKSCGCNSHKKNSNKGSESSSYPATDYDSRYYQPYPSKHEHHENNELLRKAYDFSDNQSNRGYQPYRQSNSAYLNQSNNSFQDTSRPVNGLPYKNQSTMGFYNGNSEASQGRYDVEYLSQSIRRRSLRGTSLMDFVNDSIEDGLKIEKQDIDTSKRVRREFHDSDNESLRDSPSGSKRLKMEESFNSLKYENTNEQILNEEKIEVISMDTAESAEPRKRSTPSPGKTIQIKQEVNPARSTLNLAPKTESGSENSVGTTKPNSKIPALDYLISKVLVERLDIPFTPKNHEIKRIFCGEGKGQLRLMDLIELQVEESLKV